MDTIKELRERFDSVLEHFKTEIAGLRTGRATPALVEDLEIDYYGSPTPLKAVASISSPEPRTLLIQPWDKSAVQAIEKAIQSSSLGLNPATDRDAIRLSIPSLTEERRKELAKLLGRHTEDARIQIRRGREDSLRAVDHKEKQKEISEDEKFRLRNEVQKVVDEVNKKIEDANLAKEKEIMTV